MFVSNNQCESHCVTGPVNTDQFPKCPCIFKQAQFSQEFAIPCQQPDILSLSEVTVAKVEIKSIRIIATPKGLALDNTILTGKKAVIRGTICFRIIYQSPCGLNITEKEVLFNDFVIVPEKWDSNTPVFGTAIVEDVLACRVDERTLQVNVILFINLKDLEAEPCPPPCPPLCPPPCPPPCPSPCPDNKCITIISIHSRPHVIVPLKKKRKTRKKCIWG
ncbi:MAG: hypothetical protein PHC60_09690 [Heliobacteriaceae bacterium]|nr:hypothetical protein [Heliobacteriaceae bacterium]MDD4588642.1 hypothetical protein [Heliobacteriaceae bacterium]